MNDLEVTAQGYLIKSYYKFIGKLYGTDHVERDLEFEKRVAEKFGDNPNRDIDIEVVLGIRKANGEVKKRDPRSIVQFVENNTGILPENTSHITFYGEFVERNENHKQVRAKTRKDRFAFQEKIRIVKNIDRKNLSKKHPETKYFEKDDLGEFSEIVKFEKNELTL